MPPTADPARLKRGDPPPPTFDYRREAAVRIREAAANLAQHLRADPVAIDDLTDFEVSVMETGGQRAVLKRAAREAGQIAKAQRAAERAAMRKVPYRGHSRASLDAGGWAE